MTTLTFPHKPMTYICHLSGGITSWAAAKKLRMSIPDAEMVFLFCDTFIESADTYRFLIAGCANIAGVPVPDCIHWDIPPINLRDPSPRRNALANIGVAAMDAIPGLNWIAEGRTPWEVFQQERFIGNSRKDPCSRILKRELMDNWRLCRYAPDECAIVVGLNWDEDDRIVKLMRLGLPWQFIAPLGEKPWESKAEIIEWAVREGLPLSSAYLLGLAHDNCGGGCVKAGQGHWLMILELRPDIYRQWEDEELLTMDEIKGKWSMLKCRRGGKAKPLTLRDLRLRHQKGDILEVERLELGGCACALAV